MPEVIKQALVPYSAEQMYQLVNDIQAYPDFVPYCRGSEVLANSETEVIARLDLELGLMAKSFTTRNTLKKNKNIVMDLEQGPFKYLKGIWTFKNLGNEGCKVDFELRFTFSNQLASLAFNQIFSKMSEKLFDAFLTRAGEINHD